MHEVTIFDFVGTQRLCVGQDFSSVDESLSRLEMKKERRSPEEFEGIDD